MKPRRYLDEEVDVIASLRNLKGLWSDVVGIARARPVAAVFVGMILLAAIVPKPIRFEDYPKAKHLTEDQRCTIAKQVAGFQDSQCDDPRLYGTRVTRFASHFGDVFYRFEFYDLGERRIGVRVMEMKKGGFKHEYGTYKDVKRTVVEL